MKNLRQILTSEGLGTTPKRAAKSSLYEASEVIHSVLATLQDLVDMLEERSSSSEGGESLADLYPEVSKAVGEIRGPISKRLSEHERELRHIREA